MNAYEFRIQRALQLVKWILIGLRCYFEGFDGSNIRIRKYLGIAFILYGTS